jgi:hypothetical protein
VAPEVSGLVIAQRTKIAPCRRWPGDCSAVHLNLIAGDLSHSRWTGVRLMDLLGSRMLAEALEIYRVGRRLLQRGDGRHPG